MKREKEEPPKTNAIKVKFRDFKVHSDNFKEYFEDAEPSFRMNADTEKPNRADIDFKKLVENKNFPSYDNAGLKKQEDRRYK